ncbi:MAG TPA: bacterial transcriptional activator domain-containing protein [Caldimonas sp.]|nr:bacterial transcriptional activator domain-containing protein [Caldimonas sp.]
MAAASGGAMLRMAPRDAVGGERLLEQGGLAALHAALAEDAGDDDWLQFWRGYALQFEDLTLAREAWLRAEAGFERSGEEAGLTLAACGLVQCALMDSLSYAGFDARAERVARLGPEAVSTRPLALFRRSARILLAVERRVSGERLIDDIEQAFTALGADIEPEIALRGAIAALPMLGLGLDRVRVDDFVQVGARVAASPRVGAYSRALWHVTVVEARFYDASWSARLHGELDAVDRLPDAPPLGPLRVRGHLLRAALALGTGDARLGRSSLDAAHALLNPAHPRDYWQFHFYSSRHALLTGEPEKALEHATVCLRKQIDANVPEVGTSTIRMQLGHVLVALDRLDEAVAAYARAGELSEGAQATPCLVHVHLTRALQRWRAGARDEARAELIGGFAQARGIALTHFYRALPAAAAHVCAAALDLDADAEFARRVIEARSLTSPDLGIARWPWPLRLRALGGFAIEREGEPFRFGRKAPKRMLDLLRAVVALGGRQVDGARLAALMWPDAEGDEARDALKAMLHRLRALLGPNVLAVRDGQLSFDERRVWIDTWAFEHVSGRVESLLAPGHTLDAADAGELEHRRVQVLALYRGHFLGEADVPAWALPLRDRLRARFVRAIEAMGHALERRGRHESAIALYRAALEQDNLAEELYQRLIECHVASGEPAQALNAYRRCRELLSIVLGLKPSARTEALVARIPGR